MRKKAVAYIITATFLFGIMNVLVKELTGIPSYEVVLFRSVISFMLTFYLLKKNKLNPFSHFNIFLILRGLTGSISLLLFFYTLQHLPLATAVTVQYLAPIFTIIIAALILKEKINWPQWLFFMLSFIGILLIKGFDPNAPLFIIMLGVLSAIGSGVSYNAIRKIKNDEPAVVVVFYLPLTTIPVITPYCVTHWVMPVGIDWLLLVGVGIVTQFGQLYLTRAYQMEKAGNIAHYTYLGVVFALLFGYFIFNESYGFVVIAGMSIVIIGVLLNYLYVNRVTNTRRFVAYMRHFPGMW